MARRLDVTDLKLLSKLQGNARLSYVHLAKMVGLSGPATATRMQRLEDAGVILGYRAVLDPRALGYPIQAHVLMKAPTRLHTNLVKELKGVREILEIHIVTGEDLLLVQIVARSVDHLDRVASRLADLGDTKTMIVLTTPLPFRGFPLATD